MNSILKINMGEQSYNVFMSNSFEIIESSSAVHKHNHTEIHIVSGGKITFNVGGCTYNETEGNIFAVPGNTYHSWSRCADNIVHYAFQTDLPVACFKAYKLNANIVSEFFNEIIHSAKTNDYAMLSAYFNLVCTGACDVGTITVQRNIDYALLIEEFFSNRYSEDVCLSDLAKELSVSPRQTERLVQKYTGNSFKNEIINTRMNMADMLIASTDMSLAEIAAYVGYKSYAGFWKARKKKYR